jgi:hypothetical protein
VILSSWAETGQRTPAFETGQKVKTMVREDGHRTSVEYKIVDRQYDKVSGSWKYQFGDSEKLHNNGALTKESEIRTAED